MKHSVTVKLTRPLAEWVEQQLADGAYPDSDRLFRDAVRALKRERLRAALERRLLDSLDSGDPIPVTPEFWAERRRELERRIAARKRKNA